MKNSMIFRRVGAYLIDFVVIMLVNLAIAYVGFINPRYDEYRKYSEEYNIVLNDYYEKKIDINEFNDKVQNMAYDLNYNGYVYIIGDIVVAFLYFGVFQYVTKGQTLGKKLLNIKVVGNNKKELKLHNYFIRTFILNGVILNIITFIAVNLGRDNYYKVYSMGTNIDYILMIVIFVMVMLSAEGRGLHDVLAGTKVVDARDIMEEDILEKPVEEKEELKVEEAKIEEVKEEKIEKPVKAVKKDTKEEVTITSKKKTTSTKKSSSNKAKK